MTNFTHTHFLDASSLNILPKSQEHNSSNKNTFQMACLEPQSEVPKIAFIPGYFASHRMSLHSEVEGKKNQNHPSIRYNFSLYSYFSFFFFPFSCFHVHRTLVLCTPSVLESLALSWEHSYSKPSFLYILPRLHSHRTNPLEFQFLIPNAPNIRTCSLSHPLPWVSSFSSPLFIP